MEWFYSEEKNVQVLLALLKAHNIKRVIASPGSTNVCIVASMQSDPYFEMYSCVDERSAAYMACGIAEETGEPVVLSCTGATSSRNYMPAMTEAFYRKLPIIAITSSQMSERIGHLIPQVTDRRSLPADIVLTSVQVPPVKLNEDIWNCSIQINKALTECRRRGGGPVHINLETRYSKNFNTKTLPTVQVIKRIEYKDLFPALPITKTAIFIGSHKTLTPKENDIIDKFCSIYDAIVLYEMTSGYNGNYGVKYDLIAAQEYSNSPFLQFGLIVQIGEMAGADFFSQLKPQKVWRVNQDGEIRDTFKKLEYVFEMDEFTFFNHYNQLKSDNGNHSLLDIYNKELEKIEQKLENSNLPFSNIWIANILSKKLPNNAEIHAGIMNSFRAWNLFKLPKNTNSFCNVGGYGIDGCVSSMIGASLIHPEKIYFGIFGDLAFFYDLNILGNHHIKNNVRILLVNNGKGNEFHNETQPWSQFGDKVDCYGAAGGHFGCKSPTLVKEFVTNLGFEYLTSSSKEEFLSQIDKFIIPTLTERPIVFEVFTNGEDDSAAYKILRHITVDSKEEIKDIIKNGIRKSLGDTKSRILADLFKK